MFRRRLPKELGGGELYTSGSAGLKYLLKPMRSMDPVLCNMAVEFVEQGHVVWDIGANVGLFTFASAHRAGIRGEVIAIDADIWLVQLLRRSALIQPRSSAPVRIIPTAVAASFDLRTFNIASRSRASNFLDGYGNTQTGGVAETQTVVSVTLDWLAGRLPRPQVVKIDVEGAEREVLQGGFELLREARPVILCEVGAESAAAVTALLKGLGYRLYDAEAAGNDRQELETASWSTVAVPE